MKGVFSSIENLRPALDTGDLEREREERQKMVIEGLILSGHL